MSLGAAGTLPHPILPEDRARANFYAILAALYRDAPEPSLLGALAAAAPIDEADDGALASAWNRLIAACRVMDGEAARQEYWDLFVGTGRSELNLHGSHWRSGFMMEKPLVELRDELERLGFARKSSSSVAEDHLSALFETMRLMIEGDATLPPVGLAEQRGFFERHIDSWSGDFCTALKRSPLANFYRPVGEFTDSFMALERDSFAIG